MKLQNEVDYVVLCLNEYLETLTPACKQAVSQMVQLCVNAIIQDLQTEPPVAE